MSVSNERFQKALKAEPQAIPPVWYMRQAGRYHSHYQALRKQHSFVELCKNPDLAAEVARGPVAEFDFDLAILFSDLLFPLEVFGMGLEYNPGPQLAFQLDEKSISSFKSVEQALPGLQFQREAMKKTRQVLPENKSLIGFVGGPWTLFGYAVEGSHAGGLKLAKAKLPLFKQFCELMVPLLIQNIQLQFDGGAEAVMVLDTASGELSPGLFNDLVVPPLAELAKAFPGRLGYYSKATTLDHLDPQMHGDKNWGGFGYDHRWSMQERLLQRRHGFIQGNLDQTLLFQDHETFKKTVDAYLQPMAELSVSERAGWVCGLGHGVLPQTPEANVAYYIQRIREVLK